jgi:hypothetical protein
MLLTPNAESASSRPLQGNVFPLLLIPTSRYYCTVGARNTSDNICKSVYTTNKLRFDFVDYLIENFDSHRVSRPDHHEVLWILECRPH